MAVIVSDRFREIAYSGGAEYSCELKINNITIPISQIQYIKFSNPIIDKDSETFYVGTFISQQVSIKFKNLDNIDIQSGYNVDITIGLNVDGNIESVIMGSFIIDELSSDYQKTYIIPCLDIGVNCMLPVDYTEALDETGLISLEDLLIWLCNYYGIELGTYPKVNNDKKIGFYDSTISGKRYFSYIAEMFAGNVKIGRDKKLNIIPLKQEPVVTINALASKSWTLGEKYKISRVAYDNGITPYSAGEDTDNTLFIRTDNLFVIDEESIINIYNAVSGFEIYSVETENYGDISLDAWDIIKFTLGDEEYLTYNNNELTYEMNIMTKISTKIPSKQQETTTNIIGGGDTDTKIRKVYTEINQIDATLKLNSEATSKIALKAEENASQINNNYQEIISKFDSYTPISDTLALDEKVTQTIANTYSKTEISQIANGTFIDPNTNEPVQVTKVITESGTFSNEGLRIDKTDAPTSGLFNEKGVEVSKTSDNTTIFFAGYVDESNTKYQEYQGQTIVGSDNMIVSKYFVMGSNSRFEDYIDEDGNEGTGCFWIGG